MSNIFYNHWLKRDGAIYKDLAFMGHKVFNADKTDLRFKDPKNIIAGLYAKGKARFDDTGFVQDV